jgi:hypothetical protein
VRNRRPELPYRRSDVGADLYRHNRFDVPREEVLMSDYFDGAVPAAGWLASASDFSPTVHDCPRDGEAVTLCCGKSPFDLPSADRMTVDPTQVTCPLGLTFPKEEC